MFPYTCKCSRGRSKKALLSLLPAAALEKEVRRLSDLTYKHIKGQEKNSWKPLHIHVWYKKSLPVGNISKHAACTTSLDFERISMNETWPLTNSNIDYNSEMTIQEDEKNAKLKWSKSFSRWERVCTQCSRLKVPVSVYNTALLHMYIAANPWTRFCCGQEGLRL